MIIHAVKAVVIDDLQTDLDQDGNTQLLKISAGADFNLNNVADKSKIAASMAAPHGQLYKAIQRGDITLVTPVTGTELTATEMASTVTDLLNWAISNDKAIQFLDANGDAVDNAYAGAIAADVTIMVGVTNGTGTIDPFNSAATVVVTITGGTAAGAQIRSGISGTYGAGPVTLTAVNGIMTCQVKGTGAGTILLGLSGGNTTLSRIDTATVTLS